MRKRKLSTSITAWILSASMLFSMIPPTVVSADPGGNDSIVRTLAASYDMSHAEGMLTDTSGNGMDAELVGFTDDDFGFNEEDGTDEVLNFAADKSKYVKLPAGLITGESFSIEATFKTGTAAGHWLWCLGTKENTWPNVNNYVFLNPMQDNGTIRGGMKDGATELLFGNMPSLTPDTYSTVRMDFDRGTMQLYVDGAKVGDDIASNYSIQDILNAGTNEGEDFCGYIGKSLYTPDKAFAGTLTEFSVYSPVENPDRDTAEADVNELTLPEVIEGDIELPVAGTNGSVITWTSNREDVISTDGTVTRQPFDTKVLLTATADCNGTTAERSFEVLVKASEDKDDRNLVASYDMSHQGDALTDTSGNGMDARLVGMTDADFTEDSGPVLNFTGDKNKYVELPKGLIQGETFSVEATVKTSKQANHWLWCLGTKVSGTGNNYVFVNPMQGGGAIRAGIKSGSEKLLAQTAKLTPDTYATVRLDFENGTMRLLVDGVEVVSGMETGYSIQKILTDGTNAEEDICGYIGKSLYSADPGFTGALKGFKVYSPTMAEDKLAAADLEKISLPDSVYKDLDLPSVGGNGSSIIWSSDRKDLITDAGEVSPAQQDAEVILTATADLNGATAEKTFTVKVVGTDSILEEAMNSLTFAYTEIYGNITLPTELANGAAVQWSVNEAGKDLITVEDQTSEGGRTIPAGVVTRPAKDTEIQLTADVSVGDSADSKFFTFTVKAKPEEKGETAAYLFAHFTGSEGRSTDEQIYFATSENGSQWTDLRENGNPVLSSDLGDKGVRDPYLVRSPEGDKTYLIATDLSIYHRGGWGNAAATTTGSTSLVVWESSDLVNWSEPRLVDVASRIPGAGCAWAPEAFYDEETGQYVVYWATASGESNELGDPMNMYYATTRDFYTFSEPVLWIDREHSIIDTTMIQANGKYYRASGDGQITIEESDSIYDGWKIIGTLKDIFNNNNYSGAKLEGPEFFKYNDRDFLTDKDGNKVDTWGLMCDQYAEGRGYLPFRTTNMADMSTDSWSPASDVNFGSLKKRHGTILPITEEEYHAVRKAFANIEPPTGDKKVLADFTFNDEETGLSSENAKAEGTYTLKDSYDGKALYLDGSASNYLTVTDKDGKSLLTGAQELTVSYDMKPDRTETNWAFFAAPDGNPVSYMNEKYLGILEAGGSTTAERYNNSGSRPVNPYADTGSGWYHVDVVFGKTDTSVYVNGVKQAGEASSYTLEGILGTSSILQIGKANWNSGEYFKGWIDNFRVANYTLSDEEIKALADNLLSKLPAVKDVLVGTAPDRETALEYRGTDDHTAILTEVDQENMTVTSYIRKTADSKKTPVTFYLNKEVDAILVNGESFENGTALDLSEDVQVVLQSGGTEEIWTIKKPVISNNPVLPGQYADPDLDFFDGKFWIFPTTDGYPSWSGYQFHAFSSPDLVNWTDEGVIMDLKEDNPGLNENGIQIAASKWAVGSAWAPTIEEKNGKYYFYYCGKQLNGESAIGVAVADSPKGPYVDKGEPLMTKAISSEGGAGIGQAIDPGIFTDDDGKSYLLYGNGGAGIVELGDDMMSIKKDTIRKLNGLTNFRESVNVIKVNGVYHWTWSCDDANSPNYHVEYGTSDTLDGSITKHSTLLEKDTEKGILGSAHQSSILYIRDEKGQDHYYMAYHRFYTPLNIFTSGDGLGKHRETCIDEIFFDKNGYMTMTPTLEGVTAVTPASDNPTVKYITVTPGITIVGKGSTQSFAAETKEEADASVTWKVEGNSSSSTSMTPEGVLTVGADETAKQLTVTAASKANPGRIGTAQVNVVEFFGEALEEQGVITARNGASVEKDAERGNVLRITSGWIEGGNSPANGGGVFEKAQAIFKNTNFTLGMDVNIDGLDDNTSMAMIGNSDNHFRIIPQRKDNKGYLKVCAAGTETEYELSEPVKLNEWQNIKIIYSEDDATGKVSVVAGQKTLIGAQELGFKLSALDTVDASLGCTYKTGFLRTGTYDNIIVTRDEEPEITVTGIQVKAPEKTKYLVGEELNTAGLEVTALYSDGSSKDVTGECELSGFDSRIPGRKTVTVSYGGFESTFDVIVEGTQDDSLLADFHFNDEETGLTSEKARATGSYTLKESYDENGKALYLDGSASNYLTVTDQDGKSLLTGAEELTISYEAKPDRTTTNWVMFAAPNGNRQEYGKEKYIGILTNNGTTTAERYNNTNGRPKNPFVTTGSDWVHVDVVISKTDTVIYLNGVKQAQETSTYGVKELLGNSSILQIGKANWGSGEYYKGWIDNFKIYSKALTAEEIKEIPDDSFVNLMLEKKAEEVKDVVISDANTTLPDYDGTVTWESAMEEVSIAEDGLSAKVVQPAAGEEPLEGKLTAVISICGKQMRKEVNVTVKPEVGEEDPYGYMMVHFIEDSNGYCEKIYLDISRGDNPEQWDPLNGGEPILASNLGTTGTRDPYITYNPETETYYIIATDLRVFGGDDAGWGTWSKSYSTKMNVWESKDLIHWSDVRQFDVARDMDGNKVAELGMMWAPEATWVPDYYGEGKGAFVVYWSSKTYAEDDPNHDASSVENIMWGATTDFTQETFEYGGKFLDGGAKGWIDTTIIQNEGRTYHITKSNELQIIMEYTDDKEWWKEGTQWTRVQERIGQSRFGSVEGPAVFKDHSNDNRWYLFVDDLPSPGYQPMISTDLNQGWDYLDSPDYFLTPNTKHGGVISLTKKQYDAVRGADAVSPVTEELDSVEISQGKAAEELAELLPQTAQVNLAYNMGTSELPVIWDTSDVNLDEAGTYKAVGTVQSISANKGQWVGKDGSTKYDAEDKQLYSSRAIKVSAEVVVKAETPDVTVTKIQVKAPDKTEYLVGEELNTAGMKVTALYSDGTSKDVTKDSKLEGFDSKTPGTKTVTVSYEEKTADFQVTVKEKIQAGWVQEGSKWKYRNPDGSFLAETWKQIDGQWYYFNEDTYMATGWLLDGKTWYYLKASGAMATGWLLDGNTWYYLKANGAMVTGWLQLGETWYYLKANGMMATGWLLDGKTWYYLKASGAMATGWLLDGKTWYYLKANGAMVTGWLQLGKTWYYLKSNGAMATGWLLDGKTWYYLKASGAMATGWLLDGKTWYYLKSNGAMATGWLLDGKTWYYLKANGAMATGWIKVGSKWYYLYSSGAMASSKWIGKYYVNASGAWTKTR